MFTIISIVVILLRVYRTFLDEYYNNMIETLIAVFKCYNFESGNIVRVAYVYLK